MAKTFRWKGVSDKKVTIETNCKGSSFRKDEWKTLLFAAQVADCMF